MTEERDASSSKVSNLWDLMLFKVLLSPAFIMNYSPDTHSIWKGYSLMFRHMSIGKRYAKTDI
jgi:hypothetical protein